VYKKYDYIVFISLLVLSGCSGTYRISRSSFRTYKNKLPEISVTIDQNNILSGCISSHYARSPIFSVFDEDYFLHHQLPTIISSRTPTDIPIHKDIIEQKMLNLLDEVHAHKNTFKDFILIQRKNFNRKKVCGLLVLKFKQYPFIVKLFIETPKTFINFYCKGLEPITFFFMAHGSNRHCAGLTRITNLEYIKHKLSLLPHWNGRIHLPRKWFWKPPNVPYITITGSHIYETQPIISTRIPSIYAVIADYIDIPNGHIAHHKTEKRIIMDLCRDLDMVIDPHITNFIVHTDADTNLDHITILDTEHFPSMVGNTNIHAYTNYTHWYLHLITKYMHDTFGKLKNERN
jgi:hypothetical protein